MPKGKLDKKYSEEGKRKSVLSDRARSLKDTTLRFTIEYEDRILKVRTDPSTGVTEFEVAGKPRKDYLTEPSMPKQKYQM